MKTLRTKVTLSSKFVHINSLENPQLPQIPICKYSKRLWFLPHTLAWSVYFVLTTCIHFILVTKRSRVTIEKSSSVEQEHGEWPSSSLLTFLDSIFKSKARYSAPPEKCFICYLLSSQTLSVNCFNVLSRPVA